MKKNPVQCGAIRCKDYLSEYEVEKGVKPEAYREH